MLNVNFKIVIAGLGENVDECWQDAVEAFTSDPGITPDKGEYEIISEKGLRQDADNQT